MTAHALLDQLVKSPRFPSLMDRAQEILADEQRRREQFYESITEGTKQEFINGEIIVHSPVRLRHDQVSGAIYALLRAHVRRHELGHVGHEKLLVVLKRNDYEPDVCFFSQQKSAGFTPDQMKFPPPDLAVEVLSESTEATDRGVKFEDYAANGVREYWIVDSDAQVIEQYALAGDQYELKLKMNSGVLRSEAVPGFEVPVRALFDERENLAAMQRLLA